MEPTDTRLIIDANQGWSFGATSRSFAKVSRCIAPAFVVGQFCRFADLDGPLLLKHDRLNPVCYQNEMLAVPTAELWG